MMKLTWKYDRLLTNSHFANGPYGLYQVVSSGNRWTNGDVIYRTYLNGLPLPSGRPSAEALPPDAQLDNTDCMRLIVAAKGIEGSEDPDCFVIGFKESKLVCENHAAVDRPGHSLSEDDEMYITGFAMAREKLRKQKPTRAGA